MYCVCNGGGGGFVVGAQTKTVHRNQSQILMRPSDWLGFSWCILFGLVIRLSVCVCWMNCEKFRLIKTQVVRWYKTVPIQYLRTTSISWVLCEARLENYDKFADIKTSMWDNLNKTLARSTQFIQNWMIIRLSWCVSPRPQLSYRHRRHASYNRQQPEVVFCV